MNKNIKSFFDGHSKTDTFYFTTDGQAYKNKPDADAHGQLLEKKVKGTGGVTMVTRAQVAEWWKTQAPKEVLVAQANYDAAVQAEQDAQNNLNGLAAGTPPSKVAQFNNVLAGATAAVTKAKAELDKATSDAALVADKEAIAEDAKTPVGDKVGDAQKVVDNAQLKLDEAKAAQLELAEDATPKAKGDATKAVNAAQKALDAANVALEAAQAGEGK